MIQSWPIGGSPLLCGYAMGDHTRVQKLKPLFRHDPQGTTTASAGQHWVPAMRPPVLRWCEPRRPLHRELSNRPVQVRPMPIINRVADLADEIVLWRRDLHENPELGYDVDRTASIVAERLKSLACDEVVPGIGKTGVVGVIHGRKRGSGRVLGLRADMDALPLEEITGLPYASKTKGKMHACGHDGHTAMLLGAARYLAETRNFDGTAVVIFQPAEERGAGGKAMVDDGLMTRWGVQEVYGMHNTPGLPVGSFATRKGAQLAAVDVFAIHVEGKGSHAAEPHKGVDTLVA